MNDVFRQTMRTLRQAKPLSHARLARLMFVSPGTVGHIETGHVRATVEHARAADQALGTTPLLATLLGIESEDDDVRRRALLGFTTAAIGAVAASPPALSTLGEVLRRGLHEAVSEPADWRPIVDDLERRLVLDPTPTFGQSLVAQLTIARQAVAERPDDTEAARAAGHLSLLYGLWMGNGGQLAEALGWYRTGAVLAGRSKDAGSLAWTLGRAASRGVYEGMPAHEVEDHAGRALAVSAAPSVGAVEARAAMVHLAALRGDLAGGRHSVTAMRELAARLPDGPAGPHQRSVSFNAYLECRLGAPRDAERAHDEAEQELAQVPLWLADSRLYWALALTRSGDVQSGTALAARTVEELPYDVHVLALGVKDVLRVVPRGMHSDEIELLRGYAGAAPGPWETLR